MACLASPTVGGIVQDLCVEVGVYDFDTSAIDDIEVRGFMAAGNYSAADTIRTLQRAYFFDFPEIDGQLVAVLRGGAIVATINRSDMVRGQEADFESVREQGVEFPTKLHVVYANAESDYTPTKETSERRSGDIKSFTETTIEMPLNLTSDDMAQIADKMHKVAWAEFEGTVKFGVSEKFAYLVPSDPLSVETDSGVYRRVRIYKIITVDGVLQLYCVIDRAAAIASSVVAPPIVDPVTPGTNLPGGATYEIMDIPTLDQSHDTLHIYVAAYGTNAAWTGAVVEQLIDTEWIERGQVTFPSSIGALLEELPTHSAGLDVTNSVLLSLSDDDIGTITQTEFEAGVNAAIIGEEIVFFRDVAQEGSDYRISHLTRGALNTTPATHAISTRFVKLDAPERILVDAAYIGQSVTYRVYSIGTLPAVSDETTFTFVGKSQQEWAPLDAIMELIAGDWIFSWNHNKRVGAPVSPIISAHFLNFQINLTKGATQAGFGVGDSMTLTDAEQISFFGASITSWDTAVIFGLNQITGPGDEATFADITGDKLAFPDGTGYLLFPDGTGALLLD